MKKSTIYPIVSLFAIIAISFFSRSCANTTTPPSGGDKDSIPPVMIEVLPAFDNIMHPIEPKKSSISFEFDEYVVLKEPMNNIFLSPPLSKRLESKIKGKKVIISFPEPLDSNTTYSLDLGEAIVDNNEGNIFPKVVYSFSTGEWIDSIFVSGTILDAKTMLAQDKITILFHTDPSDSAVFNLLPIAAGRSDKWGYFTVRNLKPGPYRIFAITDVNNNNKYDPDNEKIAFIDSIFVAEKVMRADLPELASLDMKDTLNCLSRESDLRMYLFTEVSSRQFLKNKERLAERMMYITFAAPYSQIDSMGIVGIDSTKLIKEYNITKDSLVIWINDQNPIKDTLQLKVRYLKTDDSLKILLPFTETHKMIIPKRKMAEDKYGKMVEVKDTVAKFDFIAPPENVEQDGFILEFKSPLLTAPFDSIKITSLSTKQQTQNEEFTVEQDSTNIRKYIIRLKNEMVIGYEYKFKFPHRQFFDINGLPCDSLEKKISIPNDDNLSSLTADLRNVNSNYIVELINDGRNKVYRQYRVNSDCKLLFPYLKAGKFSFRITEDINGNGIIDTGSLLEKRQPEKVLLYKFGKGLSNDAYIIELPERMDVEQTIDIAEMFK